MFEVLKRDGIAHLGSWEYKGHKISTPAIMFIKSDRIKAPDEVDVMLGKKPEDKSSLILPEYRFLEPKSDDDNIAYIDPNLNALKDLERKELTVINNCIQLLRHPRGFCEFITALRKKIGYQRLIYAPGIAAPWNIALLLYVGVDLVDGSRLVIESRMDNFLTNSGKLKKDDRIICFCKGCHMEDKYESLLFHNYYAAIGELELAKRYVKDRRLRELVEVRAVVDEWSIRVLRHMDLRDYDFQERHYPVSARPEERLRAFSPLSLHRPDIVRFRRRLAERYGKPSSARILLLVPCSAKKPYSASKTHMMINSALSSHSKSLVHKVVVTSPLGLVPMELELFYPAQHYEIPVTGDWNADERAMLKKILKDFLEKNEYDSIIAHLGAEENIVKEIMGDLGFEAQYTALEGNVTSRNSIGNLKNAIEEMVKGYEPPSKHIRLLENMKSLSRFQFGPLGEKLVAEAEVKGIYPNLKIMRNGKQLGMLSAERGMISLTLEGAGIIAEEKGYRVEIEDFRPQSTVFAVGVTAADDDIRIGDEVVVVHNEEVRGVGTAAMNPEEMIESDRGIAIRVRHHI